MLKQALEVTTYLCISPTEVHPCALNNYSNSNKLLEIDQSNTLADFVTNNCDEKKKKKKVKVKIIRNDSNS